MNSIRVKIELPLAAYFTLYSFCCLLKNLLKSLQGPDSSSIDNIHTGRCNNSILKCEETTLRMHLNQGRLCELKGSGQKRPPGFMEQ